MFGRNERLSQYANLTADNRAKVDAKLVELGERTGQSWSCEVIDSSGHGGLSSLEITVDGRMSRPVVLGGALDDRPADRICNELDRSHLK